MAPPFHRTISTSATPDASYNPKSLWKKRIRSGRTEWLVPEDTWIPDGYQSIHDLFSLAWYREVAKQDFYWEDFDTKIGIGIKKERLKPIVPKATEVRVVTDIRAKQEERKLKKAVRSSTQQSQEEDVGEEAGEEEDTGEEEDAADIAHDSESDHGEPSVAVVLPPRLATRPLRRETPIASAGETPQFPAHSLVAAPSTLQGGAGATRARIKRKHGPIVLEKEDEADESAAAEALPSARPATVKQERAVKREPRVKGEGDDEPPRKTVKVEEDQFAAFRTWQARQSRLREDTIKVDED